MMKNKLLGFYRKAEEFIRVSIMRVFLNYSVPRWVVFLPDNLLVFLLFLFAYLVRYNFASAEISIAESIVHGLLTTGVYMIFALVFHSYAGILRHTTLTDITLVFLVTTMSLFAVVVFSIISKLSGWSEYLTIPISVTLIHYVTVTVILFFIRLSIKILFRFATRSRRSRKKVLIFGAGDMGFVVKRVLLSDPMAGFHVSGFIDDNKRLQGAKINGIPVYSPTVFSSDYIYKNRIDTLIIAINNVSAERKRQIINQAIDAGLEILKTPSINTWLHGKLDINQLKKVKLEDLLGREPIKLNLEIISRGLTDKVILVTGAAGSIGSEIVRQLANFRVKDMLLLDQAETPMFHLENELVSNYIGLKYKTFLADVTNHEKMEQIFREYRPEIIFHAAAYKHVPLMENNPHEAIRVNAGGTKLVTELALKYGVEKFVMVSTDKSVNPTNVMGASKRICEKIVQSQSRKEKRTQFVITRFGNVLGSNGSVIPLFEKQIKEGGPVTVTHPQVNRFFMTIPEACQLVLEAGFMGRDDEIFVFDMGEPVPIVDLAYQMIRLSGLVPERDIEVIFTGLRPGEKLYEELLTDGENTLPTHHPKIKIAQVDNNCGVDFLEEITDFLFKLYSCSKDDVIRRMKALVPEYAVAVESNTSNIKKFKVPERSKKRILL